jgi:cold shock CspA family protein
LPGWRWTGKTKPGPPPGRASGWLSKKGYGFLKNLEEGREIFFHGTSLPPGDFQRLEIGTGVRYVEAAGEEGPQASTVQIVDKPGARDAKTDEPTPGVPHGWK